MALKTAIITGAGRGIGQAVALDLARRGYALGLMARSGGELQQTQRLCGSDAMVLPGDVSRSEQVNQAVALMLQRFGRLDAAIHCAGMAPSLSVEQTRDEDWNATIGVNLSGGFFLARAAWGAMRRQGGGCVVLVSSLSARDPFPGFCAYGSAKAGVNLLALALAREGAAHNIRVHAVAPGAVETRMLRSLFPVDKLPPEMTLRPEQVASVIAQCIAGDLAATSGEVIWLHR